MLSNERSPCFYGEGEMTDYKKYDTKHKASAEYRFFLFDPEGDGLIFFKDETERESYAKTSIDEYNGGDEGWSEDVEFLCAGTVTHIVTKTNAKKRPDELDEDGCAEDGTWWDEAWEETCNYELLPVEVPAN